LTQCKYFFISHTIGPTDLLHMFSKCMKIIL
jgi:hypothetical protein